MEEKKYPIYNISARWNQDDYKNNGSSFSIMLTEDEGISKVNQRAIEWWENIVETKVCHDGIPLKDKNPQLISLSARFVEWETWCLEWFCHYTCNIHFTDYELIKSFESFVARKKIQNERNGHDASEPRYNSTNLPYYCLMGAENRWRWKQPCRCEGCTKAGVVRITH